LDEGKKFEIPTLGLRNNDFMYCEVALSTEEVSLKMQHVTKNEKYKVYYIDVTNLTLPKAYGKMTPERRCV
jgi:uncharacterized protein YkuJ